jgi:beta-RFAP synthase
LGRRFGSVGLVIEGFETEIELSAALAEHVTADTPETASQLERAKGCLQTLRVRTGREDALHLRLLRVLPSHAGFGSGTQLALSIARAFARWHRLDVGTPTLAHWLGRGQRSGIGIHGFDQGGLLVDGGPGADGQPAPCCRELRCPRPGASWSCRTGGSAAWRAMPKGPRWPRSRRCPRRAPPKSAMRC